MKTLLMPGMDGTGLLFERLAFADAEVVSYPPDEVLGYDALLERIVLPEGRFVIVAESFSGPLGVRIAAAHPERVALLVLAASFVRCPVPAPRFIRHAFVRLPSPPRSVLRALLGADVRHIVDRVSPKVLAARLREIIAVDVSEIFRSSTTPVLYIQGSRDRLVRPHVLRELRMLRPDLRTRVVDAPHLVLQTRPEECARAIQEML